MRKQLLTALCASCLVIGAQAQTSTDPSSSSGTSGSSSSSGQPGYSGTSGSQSGWTSRMGHMGQELRASQLTGAQVTGSSGNQIGTISDVILNPGSGRIDFAVISLSSSGAGSTGGATSPSGSSSSTATSSDTSSSSSKSAVGGSSTAGGSSLGSASSTGKQVAVPWMLLRSSGSGTTSTTSTTSQPGFVFTGDSTKLESAPSFDATTDLSQPGWRHSIFSYFGLSGGSATGASETPGGSSSGSLQDSTSGSPK